jgi:hypothetical protein
MKACVFAHINQLPLVVTNYHQVKVGVYLRGEKSKRNYNQCFRFQKNVAGALLDKINIYFKRKAFNVVEEPLLEIIPGIAQNKTIYTFNAIPHWSDYFQGLKEQRPLVIDLFYQLLVPGIKKQLDSLDAPYIGVHIRMGDFRKLMPGDVFSKLGGVRTPEDYFVEVIEKLRAIYGNNVPVAVFTDGYRNEFKKISCLPHLRFIEGNSDMVDLLLLSRSKVIVTSASSTFGYWSGFLSDAPIIIHPDHIHQPLRIQDSKPGMYEGALDDSGLMFLMNNYLIGL